ncbi:MAG TPA: MarR family transcriptional regulator, partial [Stellaceae bacterium]|nr:MarR family transcriptional regulator [Stellaceae bacterium]
MKLNPSPRRGVAVLEADGLILERFLPYRLSTLTLRISNAIARSYERRFNLSVPEWRVMAVL